MISIDGLNDINNFIENHLDSHGAPNEPTADSLYESAIETTAAIHPRSAPFRVRRVKDIDALYQNLRPLGSGSSCSVMNMKERATGDIYAVKELTTSVPFHSLLFQNEVEMLSVLEHPQIIRYHGHYADEVPLGISRGPN